MNKLIMPIITILIGLNLSSCDPEETFHLNGYTQTIKNDSDHEITWLYHRLANKKEKIVVVDTLIIAPNGKSPRIFEGYHGYGYDVIENLSYEVILRDNLFNYNLTSDTSDSPKFQLYVGEQLIKEWKGTADHLGDIINSPYNYDSWEIIEYEDVVKAEGSVFIHGELVFTITNDDLN